MENPIKQWLAERKRKQEGPRLAAEEEERRLQEAWESWDKSK